MHAYNDAHRLFGFAKGLPTTCREGHLDLRRADRHPGVSVGPRDAKMGQQGATTSDIFLDGARVPQSTWWGRLRGGQKLASFHLIQAMLADSQTEAYAERAMVLEAACSRGRRQRPAPRPVQLQAVLHGDARSGGRPGRTDPRRHGVHARLPVERFYRGARLLRLYEGTSEIQRLIIANQLVRGLQS